jgi:hypothetical protein
MSPRIFGCVICEFEVDSRGLDTRRWWKEHRIGTNRLVVLHPWSNVCSLLNPRRHLCDWVDRRDNRDSGIFFAVRSIR